MEYTRESLERLLASLNAEERLAAARAEAQPKCYLEDIKPGMSLAEKTRISQHILRLQAEQN